MIFAPWNASWSSEERYEVRPCRYADGMLAMWQPFSPGMGTPVFAKPHFVRQRQSIAQMRCTVCGERTKPKERWWFALGDTPVDKRYCYMTTEAPVHHACALLALEKCPHLRRNDCAQDLAPFPDGWVVQGAILGGETFERDFGIRTHGRTIVGHLKLVWPKGAFTVRRRSA